MVPSSQIQVFYEDNHLICVYKPHRVPTQGDESGDLSLFQMVKDFIKKRDQKPGNVFLGLLHRLDRPAAGLILFGKTSKGASRLSEQFRSKKVRKIYQALVEGRLNQKKGTLIHELEMEGEKKRAELKYHVVKEYQKYTLVEVELVTGRKHQIRQQFSKIGHPILGDSKYGSKIFFEKGSIALLAKELEFFHPVEKEKKIRVLLPPDYYTLKNFV